MPHEAVQPQGLVAYSPSAQLKWLKQEVRLQSLQMLLIACGGLLFRPPGRTDST